MHSVEKRQWIDDQLASWLLDPPENGLAAALQLSILRIFEARIIERMHEEPITSFMFGAFASYSDFCADAYDPLTPSTCSWQYFPKSAIEGRETEPGTGADFALLVDLEGFPLRLAIFQAKREVSSRTRTSFSPSQVNRTGGAHSSVPQFVRFLQHAISVGIRARGREVTQQELSWAHYLIYETAEMRCVSLDQMEGTSEFYETVAEQSRQTPERVVIDDVPHRTYFWLLARGASTSLKPDGWLEIERSRFDQTRVELIKFFDLYIAQARHGPEFTPGRSASTEPLADRIAIGTKLRAAKDAPRLPLGPTSSGPRHAGPKKKL